jgi:hypothetical protein
VRQALNILQTVPLDLKLHSFVPVHPDCHTSRFV